ncbi:MAG: MarR family transcriptional regulator [Labilithrix sp.]|nr:MarR family transcriptional regulator [Labilithrix sp.]
MADQDRFARALLAVARGLGRIARERARAGDVTPQQAETLQLIAERGALSTSTLATLLGIDPSTASRNLSGLERAGLIARQKGSDDGRQTDVRLTPRGRRAAQNVGNGATAALASLLDRVPRAERARMLESLELLVKILDQTP